MTVLHAGGKFDKDTYKVSGGLHGVGGSVVNALSKHCKVTVKRDGVITTQEYEYGKAITEIQQKGNTTETGTTVVFYPDDEIFNVTEYEYDIIDERLRELAYLNSGISMFLQDERQEEKTSEYFFEGGLG